MLLSSNVIYICVRVVKLVRMVRTLLFAAARVKSCPGMHSSCVIASLSDCARTVGPPPISGGGPGTDKRKLLAQPGVQVSVKNLRAEDLKLF